MGVLRCFSRVPFQYWNVVLFEVLTTFDLVFSTGIVQSVQQLFTKYQNSEGFHLRMKHILFAQLDISEFTEQHQSPNVVWLDSVTLCHPKKFQLINGIEWCFQSYCSELWHIQLKLLCFLKAESKILLLSLLNLARLLHALLLADTRPMQLMIDFFEVRWLVQGEPLLLCWISLKKSAWELWNFCWLQKEIQLECGMGIFLLSFCMVLACWKPVGLGLYYW